MRANVSLFGNWKSIEYTLCSELQFFTYSRMQNKVKDLLHKVDAIDF